VNAVAVGASPELRSGARCEVRLALVLTPAQVFGAIEGASDLAPATLRDLASDLRCWVRFAAVAEIAPSFPVTRAHYSAWLAWQAGEGLATATVKRRASTLVKLHALTGGESPASAASRCLLHALGSRPPGKRRRSKRPLTRGMVCLAWSEGPVTDTAAALVLVALDAGLSRSEILSLTWAQVSWPALSLRIELDRGVVTLAPVTDRPCAVRALARVAPDSPDPTSKVFDICQATICRTVKRVARLAGEDPAGFSAGSLRAGHRAGGGS
jgi:integrase